MYTTKAHNNDKKTAITLYEIVKIEILNKIDV